MVKMKVYFFVIYHSTIRTTLPGIVFLCYNGDNFDRSCWGGYLMPMYLCGLPLWSNKFFLGDCMHHESSSKIVSKMDFLGCYHHRYYCYLHHYYCYCYWWYCSTDLKSFRDEMNRKRDIGQSLKEKKNEEG